MKIAKSIRTMPWPEPYESENGKQDFLLTVHWPVVEGERLLVATFTRNVKKKDTVPWAREFGPDFRLVASKLRRDLVILQKGEKGPGKLRDLNTVMHRNFRTGPAYCYPEITERDEKALAKWLGADLRKTRNHLMDEMQTWTEDTVTMVKLAQAEDRGELHDEDVALCPEELPDGLEDFIRQEVLTDDRVLIYKKGNVRGLCYCCRQNVRAEWGDHFRHNQIARCPNCGEAVLAILEGGASFKADYVQDIVAMQRGTDGKTVFLRQWHLLRDPLAAWEDIPGQLQEIARYAVRGSCAAKWQHEAKDNWYMNTVRYRLDDWMRVDKVTVIYDGSYIFYFPEGWREIVAGTCLQYCDLAGYMASADKEYCDLNPVRLLVDWPRYPAIEKLWKAGYTKLVKQRLYSHGMKKNGIRWKRNTIQEAIPFPFRLLKKIYKPAEWDMAKIEAATAAWKLVKAGRIRETEAPLVTYFEGRLEDVETALGHAPVQKIFDYVKEQKQITKARQRKEEQQAKLEGRHYYREGDNTAGTYRDYLADCVNLELDLDDRAVLFPPDLRAAHARTIAMVKYQKNEKSRAKFMEQVKKLGGLAWERDGLLIRPAATPDELTAEGAFLHHCVGGYVDSMAAGKTTILFVRKAEEPKIPYYTLEWSGGRVVQCRTKNNLSYNQDPRVHDFVDAWVERVKKSKKSKKPAAVSVA